MSDVDMQGIIEAIHMAVEKLGDQIELQLKRIAYAAERRVHPDPCARGLCLDCGCTLVDGPECPACSSKGVMMTERQVHLLAKLDGAYAAERSDDDGE